MKELKLESQEPQSCDISAKGSSCCSPTPAANEVNLTQHWDNAYSNSSEDKLGWFETDLSPTLRLIELAKMSQDARIINIGAGSTTLIDELLQLGYANLIATDISEVALNNLKARIGNQAVELVVDDLTNPSKLNDLEGVDLWVDRAVLHFFTEPKDQDTYFDLVKSKINIGGYALFAEYNLVGATVCAGLPVHRYSKEMLAEKLGRNFKLIDSFDYTYTMPSGDTRPYIYSLFKRLK